MKKFLLAPILMCFFAIQINAQNIYNGTQVSSISQAPYQVSIRVNNWPATFHTCGGSILSDRWILTAAHTFAGWNFPPQAYRVRAGTNDCWTNNFAGQTVEIDAIYIHPNYSYNNNHYNDMALLHLAQPLQFNSDVQPIEFSDTCNFNPSDTAVGTSAFITGWGNDVNPNAGNGFSQYLNSFTGQIVAAAPGFVQPNEIVFTASGGQQVTVGDSGGPAVITKNGKKIQIGVCSRLLGAGLFMSVRPFAKWIYDVTGLGKKTGQDLFIHDSYNENGHEPNVFSTVFWQSPDIWVRNVNDNLLVHQNPISYTNSNTNVVHVRVHNRGCLTSTGTEELKLYWAKATANMSWPSSWDGSKSFNSYPTGGQITSPSTLIIPPVEPGNYYTAKFYWNPPDPSNYYGSTPWISNAYEMQHHFCLTSRIVSNNDPMYMWEGLSQHFNAYFNNNIVAKNVTVVDLNPEFPGELEDLGIFGGTVFVGNDQEGAGPFILEFQNDPDLMVTEEAEVILSLSNSLWDHWIAGGSQGNNIEVSDANNHQIRVTGDYATLENLGFGVEEHLIHVGFNFLSEDATDGHEYTYRLVQKTAQGETVGGEDFLIFKSVRDFFQADAGKDQEILETEQVTLCATDIKENAIYNWYDENNKLIHKGNDLTVSPEKTTKYKLEVIATKDGFKDYDEIEVRVKKFYLSSLSPNPARTTVVIDYQAAKASTAHLIITPANGTKSDQYILEPGQRSKSINVSSYQPGTYVIGLVCDGQVVDTKQLVIQ